MKMKYFFLRFLNELLTSHESHLMNVLDDKGSRHIVQLPLVDVENFVCYFQTVAVGRTAIQLNLPISSLH